MKYDYQKFEIFFSSLPQSMQWFLIAMGAAIVFISGGVIGGPIGKALYFLTH